LIWYLQEHGVTVGRKIRQQALKCTLLNVELYRWTVDGLLLKCLSKDPARVAMGEVHEGVVRDTSVGPENEMDTVMGRSIYWPTMVDDCVRYKKGCAACQKYGEIKSVPASVLNPNIWPWPFRGWGLDFIAVVHPSSSKGHRFVLVATNYFTMWKEVMPLRNMTHKELIHFV
jgi:hypothetical protein